MKIRFGYVLYVLLFWDCLFVKIFMFIRWEKMKKDERLDKFYYVIK